MTHKVGVFAYFIAVYAKLPLIFVNNRLDYHLAVTILRLGGDFGVVCAQTDKLFVVANTERRSRAKIENGFGAVGFPLRIFTEKNV